MSLWKAYLEDQPWMGRRCLHLARTEPAGTRGLVQALTLGNVRPGELAPESAGVLGDMSEETDDFLRAIIDAAWEHGIRPTGFQDHTNELTAVRFHLEDMRLLAKVVK